VLLALNIAKNEWQMEELAPIWAAALRKHRRDAKLVAREPGPTWGSIEQVSVRWPRRLAA
jgi:hypothetical protein